MARNERNSKVICFMVCFIALSIIIGAVLYKPPLSSITYSELESVYGVGEVRTHQIQDFILDNPKAKVEDLRMLKGVDDMIIDQLEKRFR